MGMAFRTSRLIPVVAAKAKEAAHEAALRVAANAIYKSYSSSGGKATSKSMVKLATAAATKAAAATEKAAMQRVEHTLAGEKSKPSFHRALKAQDQAHVSQFVAQEQHMEVSMKAKVSTRAAKERIFKEKLYAKTHEKAYKRQVKKEAARRAAKEKAAKARAGRLAERAQKRHALDLKAKRKARLRVLHEKHGKESGRKKFAQMAKKVLNQVSAFKKERAKKQAAVKRKERKEKFKESKKKVAAALAQAKKIKKIAIPSGKFHTPHLKVTVK